MANTRHRLIEAALRLFGEQGYAATSVAQLELAAGMSPGAGGMYSHFRSKDALLRAALESVLTPTEELATALNPPGAETPTSATLTASELEVQLDAIARAGLARLRHDRDYNRILVRDLRAVPDLLELSADRELRPVHDRLAAFLSRPELARPPGVDPRALAAVLIGATSHFWLMTDIFGAHPAGITEDDYIDALVRLAASLLTPKERP